MTTPRFVAVGDLMVDVVAAGPPGHRATIRLRPGGSAGNAAVWAASRGAHATVVGAVGDDAAGRMLRNELERRGVHTRLKIDGDLPTGTFLSLDGEIRAHRGANAALAADDIPPELEADAVLVSGHLEEPAIAHALAAARAELVALDAARLSTVPAAAPVVILNEERARELTNADPEDAARQIGERRKIVCVTCGAAGAVAFAGGASLSARAQQTIDADEPGAGDAFAAAFLVNLARGRTPRDALAAGCEAGALSARLGGDWPALR